MAKQKVKHPGKLAGEASDLGLIGNVTTSVLAPVKNGGKRKVRRASGQAGPAKRAGKGKLKSRRKLAPSGEPTAAQGPRTAVEALAAGVMARLGKKAAPHKIVRSKERLNPLDRLELAVDEVRLGGRVSPRTRKLQLSGVPKMAQKVVEEAGELAIEAVLGNGPALVNESVDLLYNLVVLLSEARIPLAAIWAEMERRERALGMAEKLPKALDSEV